MSIYGINPVRELLVRRPGQVEKIALVNTDKPGPGLKEIQALADKAGIEIVRMSRDEISQAGGSTAHQGVVAKAPLPNYRDLDEIIRQDKQQRGILLLLDGIMDPQNLGSIIRVAEEAGAAGVIIPKNRSCGLTPSVLKASAGACEWLPICQVTNLSRTIEQLKSVGYWIAVAEANGETEYSKMDYNMDLALVIGSEGKGVRSLVRKHCDFSMYIPLKGRLGSLNASVATAIILFEAQRQSATEIPEP